MYFNPRTSCEVRHFLYNHQVHIPSFQSTHLVWGATWISISRDTFFNISIHAPRVRCDIWPIKCINVLTYFNPRTSCEVRHLLYFLYLQLEAYFNPRTSCEVRLIQPGIGEIFLQISIHAPRVRCDFCILFSIKFINNFNPRTSCEVRHYKMNSDYPSQIFQSTHLVWGATSKIK